MGHIKNGPEKEKAKEKAKEQEKEQENDDKLSYATKNGRCSRIKWDKQNERRRRRRRRRLRWFETEGTFFAHEAPSYICC